MLALLLVMVFAVQAEVTGVINVGEPAAATPEPTATPVTPVIIPAAAETPPAYPDLSSDVEIRAEWVILLVILVMVLAAAHMKLIK